jgi:hydroxymethylpyrimidine pyrophosphatase-like HAD family hydrolase
MFEVADEGYAVGNAVTALKDIATRIIRKNTENGVATYLEEVMNSE